jgi:hypothetical protein
MAVGQKETERNQCPGALPQGYDEYRRWRINHRYNIWSPNTTTGTQVPGTCNCKVNSERYLRQHSPQRVVFSNPRYAESGGGKGAWHLMSGNKTLFQRKLRRRIRAFARLEVLDLMGRLKSGGHRLFNRGIRFTDHTSHAIPVPNPCSSVVKTQRHISTSSSSLPPFRVFPVFRG